MTTADSLAPKGMAAAEVSRGFFGVQLHYADVFAAKAGAPLAEVITFQTNLHRLFAYGNLTKMAPHGDFLALVAETLTIADREKQLNHLIAAYAKRPTDPWPSDRHPFGNCFACEAPTAEGMMRIHFRNRYRGETFGPLHESNRAQRRLDLTAMFGHIAQTWPEAKTVNGASWLYNTDGYRSLFPAEFAASRLAMTGPRSIHGLSTWGQFLDFRGGVKPAVVGRFRENLATLDVAQPWLSFPYQVLQTAAPIDAFYREYGIRTPA